MRTVLRISFPEVPRLIYNMEGGTVYLMCFVSGIHIYAGLVRVCSGVRAVLCPSHFRQRVMDFFVCLAVLIRGGEMVMPRVDFLMCTRLSS